MSRSAPLEEPRNGSIRLSMALAGNPNSGKTTVFNAITGGRQHVGNYPGVTVERKEGLCQFGETHIRVVDLPGTYSLTAYSIEEMVARNYVINERPDVVVDILDASNIERNLYLATQLIELQVPVVLALNMMDIAEARGKRIDVGLLSELLGVPIVPIVATERKNMDELLRVAVQTAVEHRIPAKPITFGPEIEEHLAQISELLDNAGGIEGLPSRWVAIKLFENDAEVLALVQDAMENSGTTLSAVSRTRAHLEQVVGDDTEMVIADQRYGFVAGACAEAVKQAHEARRDWSQALDRVVTSRLLGIPILLVLMWALFEIVFRLGAPPTGWIESLCEWLGNAAAGALATGTLRSLIVDGVIAGVGGVLSFFPQILLLFLAIAILEDSGYMARAAFVVDLLMHRIGLHGKSFIPMLIGFGCSVPAVMATRMLESKRDRIVTVLIIPLMSCGARLPVYVLLAGAFFPAHLAGKVVFSLYVLGVILAVLTAKALRSHLLPGPATPFVMELPPYRVPTVKGTLLHTWERGWLYLRKAGTVILVISIVMWYLLSHPLPPTGVEAASRHTSGLRYTYAGRIGKAIEPALRPLGFDWRTTTALTAGFAAKEVIVSTFATVYSLEGTDETSEELATALRKDPALTPLRAYALMVFVLLYVPCVATLAIIRHETNSWKWPLFAAFYTTALAWTVTLVVYQGGRLLGLA